MEVEVPLFYGLRTDGAPHPQLCQPGRRGVVVVAVDEAHAGEGAPVGGTHAAAHDGLLAATGAHVVPTGDAHGGVHRVAAERAA